MKTIILHCSDSRWGNAAVIAKWHIERGFNGIGYHHIICNGWIGPGYNDLYYDGKIESGRPEEMDGAHVKGHNKGTIGVCLIGKSGLFTNKQITSLKYLLFLLNEKYGEINIYQHSDFDEDKFYCAGLDLNEFRKLEKFNYVP